MPEELDEPRSDEELKSALFDLLTDSISDLLYYDRKGSEVLSVKQVEHLINDGIVTAEELAQEFQKRFQKRLNEAIRVNFQVRK